MNHMSRFGMPSFHEIYMAHKETDPEKREIALAIVDLKRQSAIMRSRTHKSRMNSLQMEWKRNEEREVAARAQGVEQNARIKEMQLAMRAGTLSTRNRSW